MYQFIVDTEVHMYDNEVLQYYKQYTHTHVYKYMFRNLDSFIIDLYCKD